MYPLEPVAKTTLEQNTSVSMGSSLRFEYNMNSMIDNITVSGADITKTDSSGQTYTPFKKLFPVDSIIKPFRPQGAGLKYAISGDVDSGWKNPRSIDYIPNFRIYYPGVDTTYKYYISALNTGIDVTITYPKTILTNKIVARFELSHSTPATWTIFGNGSQLATGSSSAIVPFTTNGNKNYDAGTVTIYYNGTSWSTTEPAIPAAPVSLTSVKITSSGVSGKYVGLIELSPKWYLDATEHLVSFDISKESSTSSEDLMPVGKVSANSLRLTALDGAKILQETMAPPLFCENYSITAIIRRLLDSVGFTNYKINIKTSDDSIITPRYWWSDNTKTVWDCLQELCRDTQMTAVFSYNNVLQFYSRNWIFDSTRTTNWSFRSESSGSDLPNILSFNKNDLPSANQVKVFWNSVSTSNYVQSAQDIWKSDPYFLGAMALNNDLLSTTGPGGYINLSPSVVNPEELGLTLYNYSGYLVIGSEIIEYDAVQFEYVDLNGTKQFVDLTSKTDNNKYLGLAIQGGALAPSGKYRIKTRGALNTKVETHYAAAQNIIDSWSGYEVTWV